MERSGSDTYSAGPLQALLPLQGTRYVTLCVWFKLSFVHKSQQGKGRER